MKAGLADVGRALVSQLDVDRVIEDTLAAAQEATGAAYAAIGVIGSGHGGLSHFAFRGIDAAGQDQIGALPRGHGVLGVLIDEQRPLRLGDLGAHPRSYGFPAGHPPMRSFLGVPIVVGGTPWGNLYLTEKAGGEPFDERDEEAAVTLAAWAGVAIENARLYMHAEARSAELELTVRRLEATSAVARAVGTETDLRRVLELIVKRARALVAARALVLLLIEGDDLLVAAGAGQVDIRGMGERVPRAGSAVGRALEAGRAEALADAPARMSPDDDALGVVGAETAIIVPLVYRGTALGVLAGFDHLGDDPGFADADVELLEAFAASAATAVATAQTVERDRLRHTVDAAERERRRWARQLHDDTLQGLAGVRLMLANGLRGGDPDALQASAREASEQLGDEIARLRALIAELRPAALDQLGLGPAIRTLVTSTGDLHGLDAVAGVDDDGDERLPDPLETTLYRIVQEALANAVRHARAHRVDVRLRRLPEAIIVSISDDGDGFDPAGPLPGFGLAGMRERAALAGGTLEVVSGVHGTTVTAAFSLQA